MCPVLYVEHVLLEECIGRRHSPAECSSCPSSWGAARPCTSPSSSLPAAFMLTKKRAWLHDEAAFLLSRARCLRRQRRVRVQTVGLRWLHNMFCESFAGAR